MAKGYDNDPLMNGILLDLQFKEGTGTYTSDWAKPHHADPTLTGAPAWDTVATTGKNVLDYTPGTPDYIIMAQADTVDLNFTTGDYSVAVWMKRDANTFGYLVNRQLLNTDGWALAHGGNGIIRAFTNPGAAAENSETDEDAVQVGVWAHVLMTRSGTSIKIYVNGIDVTTTSASHSDPTTATRDTYIGVSQTLTLAYDGMMGDVRIWGRELAETEPLELYERDRDKFGI